MKDGFTMFGDMLDSGVKNIFNANKTTPLEFGTINSDLSLTTDNYPMPIPKGDYMVDKSLTADIGITVNKTDEHTHSIKNTTLSAGDRVLVGRVGTERIVLAIVVSSNRL